VDMTNGGESWIQAVSSGWPRRLDGRGGAPGACDVVSTVVCRPEASNAGAELQTDFDVIRSARRSSGAGWLARSREAVGIDVRPADAVTVRRVGRFKLQFDVRDVNEYASRYAYEDDSMVLAIGRTARECGCYTREEFIVVCRWKTPRSGPLVATNSASEIEIATRTALTSASTERERTDALRSLAGVEFPTASVLLHLANPERYPILDKRALHALGVRAPATYSFRLWSEYVEEYRRLAEAAGVDGRTLDRALWQWSSEQGLLLY
jgi:hypothetical protein